MVNHTSSDYFRCLAQIVQFYTTFFSQLQEWILTVTLIDTETTKRWLQHPFWVHLDEPRYRNLEDDLVSDLFPFQSSSPYLVFRLHAGCFPAPLVSALAPLRFGLKTLTLFSSDMWRSFFVPAVGKQTTMTL